MLRVGGEVNCLVGGHLLMAGTQVGMGSSSPEPERFWGGPCGLTCEHWAPLTEPGEPQAVPPACRAWPFRWACSSVSLLTPLLACHAVAAEETSVAGKAPPGPCQWCMLGSAWLHSACLWLLCGIRAGPWKMGEGGCGMEVLVWPALDQLANLALCVSSVFP